jgi:carboxymethylenebutenolidase
MQQISIKTDDGVCPAYDFGSGPSVLFFIDGIGMRPAMHAMGERLAAAGYHVLMPDLFWRMGPYTAPEPAKLFTDPSVRADWFKRAMGAASVELIMRDTKAYLASLPGKVGVTGYCMGGRMALSAAGTYPDRVVAAAAYHPGNPANDAADSPHLLAPKMKAAIYVGGASDDATFPPEQQERLAAALKAAQVAYEIEIYPAKHGWVPSDTPVHDPVAAEKHWRTLEALFARTLA